MVQVEIDVEVQRAAEAQRYSRRNILRSEYMYGRGFQSPGGLAAVESFCRRLDLRPGMLALEVGSGLGGASFHLARRYGLQVVGLDVSPAMIQLSEERRVEEGIDTARFVLGDVRFAPLDPSTFDLVWTRDCVLYLAEKSAVWSNVARCLKPGGALLVTDFARGAEPLSPGFRAYLEGCGYHLQTLDDYAGALAAAGLEVTRREDITDEFVAGLAEEKARLVRARSDFLREYTGADYDYLVERWDQKIAFCESGDLKWGLFVARKRAA